VQFFEWDSEGDKKNKKSWWQIFQSSVDDLKPLGCGLVWLPREYFDVVYFINYMNIDEIYVVYL
jgi:hypothetical protein